MQFVMFLVDQRPHCLWDDDISRLNREFLTALDHEFFAYEATAARTQMTSDQHQRAAMSLRVSYYLAMETFFALVLATLQAPGAVVGWMLQYRTQQLRRLVGNISSGQHIPNRFRIQQMSWDTIVDTFMPIPETEVSDATAIRQAFSTLWARFAREFVNDTFSLEHNSLKHGFRAQSGGFTLMMGPEQKPGESSPPEEMTVLGQSKYGASFFSVNRILDAPVSKKRDPHFRAVRQMVNWDPAGMATGLELLSLSIGNVKAFLHGVNEIDGADRTIKWPNDLDTFEDPWKGTTGAFTFKLDLHVSEADIHRFPLVEIERRLRRVYGDDQA